MKTFLSLKPGATFFLGSSRTLVYHKEDVEFVYRMKVGNKPIYAHVYVALSGERSVMVYADWGDYFHHLSSITDKEHFMKIMKRPCPTFVQIWECEHPDNVTVMSLNAGDTMGIGIEIEDIDWQSHPSMELPFIPEIQKTATKVFDVSTKLYSEISSHCPLKLWKDRLMAVWGEETK